VYEWGGTTDIRAVAIVQDQLMKADSVTLHNLFDKFVILC
jgi:hypothetical protein